MSNTGYIIRVPFGDGTSTHTEGVDVGPYTLGKAIKNFSRMFGVTIDGEDRDVYNLFLQFGSLSDGDISKSGVFADIVRDVYMLSDEYNDEVLSRNE